MAKRWMAFGLCGIVLGLLSGCTSGVVARVNNRPITEKELADRCFEKDGPSVLFRLIVERLVQQEAVRLGVVLTEEEVTKRLKEQKEQAFGSEEAFARMIKERGMDLARVNSQSRRDLRQMIMEEKVAAFNLRITDEDAEKAWPNVKDQFAGRNEAHYAQIVVSSKEDADKVFDLLKKGADFSAVAKDKSVDILTKNSGGDRKWVADQDIPADILQALLAIKDGQVAQPVAVGSTYYIVKRLGRREKADPRFEEHVAEVKERLLQTQARANLEPTIGRLLAKAKIQITDPRFGYMQKKLEEEIKQLQPPPPPPPSVEKQPAAPEEKPSTQGPPAAQKPSAGGKTGGNK